MSDNTNPEVEWGCALFYAVGLVPSLFCILSAISNKTLWFGKDTLCNRTIGAYQDRLELLVAGLLISSAVVCPLIMKKKLTRWTALSRGEKALAFILVSVSALAVVGSWLLLMLSLSLEGLCGD